MPPLQGASGQPGLGRESGTPDSRTEGSSDPEHSLHTLLKTLLGDGRAANQPPPRTGEAPGRQAQSAGHRGLDSRAERLCTQRGHGKAGMASESPQATKPGRRDAGPASGGRSLSEVQPTCLPGDRLSTPSSN